MLSNDIFFLYPPGYCGNYLQWIINISEKDSHAKTIKDPLLPDSTTHGFVRRPTHINIMHTLVWLSRNAPVAPQTFIVNCFDRGNDWQTHAAWSAVTAMRARHNPRCVNISAELHDEIIIGALNCYTKWPTFLLCDRNYNPPDWHQFDIWGGLPGAAISIPDRNFLYDHWDKRFPINPTFNWYEFEDQVKLVHGWYTARNTHQPWEVNEKEYVVFDTVPRQFIHEVKLSDILSHDFLDRCFIPWIESQNIGEFDWDHAQGYHRRYIAAQKNLQWSVSANAMRNFKQVDVFLQSNSFLQALTLRECGPELDFVKDWRSKDLSDILLELGYQVENR